MRGAVELGVRDLRRLDGVERVEEAQLEARAQHALQGHVDLRLGQQSLLRRVDVPLVVGGASLVEQAAGRAVAVQAGLDREGPGLGRGLRVLVAGLDVAHGVAVAGDEPLELPLLAQRAVEQGLAGAPGHAVDGVVHAHHRLHLALDDRRAEGGEVGVLDVVSRGLRVEAVPQGLGAGVHGVVLGRGRHDRVVEVVALHAGDEGDPEAAGEEGILAVGLLSAAPARVAEDVDVRRVERQAAHHPPGTAGLRGLVVLDPGLARRGLRPSREASARRRWPPARSPAGRPWRTRRRRRRAAPRTRCCTRARRAGGWPACGSPSGTPSPRGSCGRRGRRCACRWGASGPGTGGAAAAREAGPARTGARPGARRVGEGMRTCDLQEPAVAGGNLAGLPHLELVHGHAGGRQGDALRHLRQRALGHRGGRAVERAPSRAGRRWRRRGGRRQLIHLRGPGGLDPRQLRARTAAAARWD